MRNLTKDKRIALLIFAILLLILAIWLMNGFLLKQRSLFVPESHHNDEHASMTPVRVMSSAFREVRVTLADLLWIKVDKYFHSSLTPEEHEKIHPGHPEHLKGVHTVQHQQKSSEFMPLLKMVTDLDPQFIEAYRVGAWWLWSRLNQIQPAIQLLQKGADNNPNHYEFNYDMGLLYFQKLNDYQAAKAQFIRASLMKMDDRDKVNVLEYLAFSYERLNENAKAITVWKEIEQMNIQPFSNTAKQRQIELNQIITRPTGKKNVPQKG